MSFIHKGGLQSKVAISHQPQQIEGAAVAMLVYL